MVERLAIFLDEDLNEIGRKKFNSTDEFITFRNGTFNVRLDAYLYKTKDSVVYAYVYPTDEKLLVDIEITPIKKGDKDYKIASSRIVKLKEKIEKGDLKLIVGESIIGQLARMAVMGLKTNWVLLLIVVVAVGLGVGWGAYSTGFNSGISEGINRANNLINATITRVIPSPTPILIQP